MSQPLLTLPSDQDASGRTLGEEEIEAVTKVLRSGVLTSTKGDFVKRLEQRFAEMLGVRYAFACNSGTAAIHTAVAALEAGRTVFAVPGRPGESSSKGPNRLIKDGAVLIESVTDILEEMRWGSVTPSAAPSLEGDEARVYAALDDALLVDDIVLRTGLAVPAAQSILMMLKLKNIILELPGGRYSRN